MEESSQESRKGSVSVVLDNVLFLDPTHIVCALCARRFHRAMDYDGCENGCGCAVFVGSTGVYAGYGSCYDGDQMSFVNAVILMNLTPGDVICDYCTSLLHRRAILTGADQDDRQRLENDRVTQKLQADVTESETTRDNQDLVRMADTLVIIGLWENVRQGRHVYALFLFQGRVYSFDGHAVQCREANYRDQRCPVHVVQFLKDYPFWEGKSLLNSKG